MDDKYVNKEGGVKIRPLSLDDHRKIGKQLKTTLRELKWIETLLTEHYGKTHVTVDAYWGIESAISNLRSRMEDMMLYDDEHEADDILDIYYGVE